MAEKIIVARTFKEACEYAQRKGLIGISDWLYISSRGDNIHKLQGRAFLKEDMIMLSTPDLIVESMLLQRIAVGEAMLVRDAAAEKDVDVAAEEKRPGYAEIDISKLRAWANRLRVIESALWDLEHTHMSSEVSIVVSQIRKTFTP